MQPGDTIKPSTDSDDKTEVTVPREQTDASTSPAASEPVTMAPEPTLSAPPQPVNLAEPPQPEQVIEEPHEPMPWQYRQADEDAAPFDPHSNLGSVNWSASEFVDHEKDSSWFTGLAAAAAAVTTIIYLITRDLITVVVIALAAVLFGITAGRKPRTLQYQIDSSGVSIGDRFYPYSSLKTFSVLEEGAFNSIQLTPLKRFMPPISLYFPPEQEENIINLLGSYLPHEDRRHDPIDRLMRRVRF